LHRRTNTVETRPLIYADSGVSAMAASRRPRSDAAEATPTGRAGGYRGKRVLDLLVVTVVAVPSSVIVAVSAAAVKITSDGPALFRQQRVGMRGRRFDILKLRTMVHDPRGNPLHPADDRITRVGRYLRRFGIDELPQLINVLRGEMSVVGPRPTLPYQEARYTSVQRRRLEVRPGLTGLAQVTGRNSITWSERIALDIDYVERQSVALDLQIILRTVATLLVGRGAGGHPTDDPISVPPTQEDSDVRMECL
jgi:lipopolysaccharide/colanic/teichoic acid biosynthesis glycosyltransferase